MINRNGTSPARRTVCGMLTAAGMNTLWHHSRAHRFFSTARWSLDQVGLTVLGLVIGWLIPITSPVVIAIDDTLFRRRGRKSTPPNGLTTGRWTSPGAARNSPGAIPLSSPRSW